MMGHFKFFIVFALLLGPVLSSAQETPQTYFRTTAGSFASGSEITVGIFIESKAPINALKIEVGYSPETLEFISFNNNDSIVDFWRREPESVSGGIIRLEGGIIKPFSGRAGEVIKINFKTKGEGLAQTSFRTANLYYADGLGTEVQAIASPLNLSITTEGPLKTLSQNDGKAPLIRDLRIAKNPVDDKLLLVFSVEDKESGIERSELRWRKWFLWSGSQRVSNPALFPASVWSIELRTFDLNGNVAERTVYIWKNLIIKTVILLVILVIIVAFYLLYNRYRKKMI